MNVIHGNVKVNVPEGHNARGHNPTQRRTEVNAKDVDVLQKDANNAIGEPNAANDPQGGNLPPAKTIANLAGHG